MPACWGGLSDYGCRHYIRYGCIAGTMTPGIGLMKRRLEKKEEAVSLAVSGIVKRYEPNPQDIMTLETKYHDDAGDWYVALGWNDKKAIVRMDSVLGTITEIKEI